MLTDKPYLLLTHKKKKVTIGGEEISGREEEQGYSSET